MNTFSAGLRRGPISPSTLALLVLGALLAFMAASPQTAFGASYVVDTTSDADFIACTATAGSRRLTPRPRPTTSPPANVRRRGIRSGRAALKRAKGG